MRLNFGRVSFGTGRPLTDLGTRSSPRGGSWAGPGAERPVTTTLGVSDRLGRAERPVTTSLGVSDRPRPWRGANRRTGGNRSGAAGVGTSLGVSSRPKGIKNSPEGARAGRTGSGRGDYKLRGKRPAWTGAGCEPEERPGRLQA
ncbi:hypothetical protein KFL_008350010 [Klebsormidium nitens]|uniref:Uncharacterized protein n=1 Tax=Klebsormidium nitens TaxID=105231 RepID=A0A1Y1IU21_KLENI|nr:hypothetical protein KFL_008350010 [Klebsormidium nitens]|eukprot:GAQ91688.1 hypothetical protein KFL_008350010 [Klebsormidium nitens]